MKRPTSINILGIKYKIKYNLDDEDAYGETDPDTNVINLRPDLPEDRLIRVLAHEITHAVIFETPFSTRKRFDLEEMCDIVGYHFIAALRDNPTIVQYLLQEIDDEPDVEIEPPKPKYEIAIIND